MSSFRIVDFKKHKTSKMPNPLCHKGFGIFKFLEKPAKYKEELKVINPVQYCIHAQGTVK
ncbi:hypothetical protein ABE17_05090 [Bacillus mycoides]|jgi:hypothetical protein|nr:hypothetical protein [Bacillus mycoides]MCD4646279.1 hypothetical protein [Bacillus mycoides]